MRRLLMISCLTIMLISVINPVYAADSSPVTISVYRGWGTERDTISNTIPLFEAAYPNIKVTIHDIADADYMAALMVQLATGVGPDVFMVQAPDAAKFIESNVMLDLTALFKRDLKMSDYLPAFASMTYNGHYYGVPLAGGGFRVDSMYIDRDILNAAGLPIPGPAIEQALTFNQYRDLARKLTVDREGDGKIERYGTYFGTGRWHHWLPSNGVTVFSQSFTDTLIDSPEAVEVLQFLQDMIVKDRTVDPASYGFVPQRAATEITWRDRVFANQTNAKLVFDWSVAPQPAGRAGSIGITNMHPFSINSATKHPEAAWEFLKFMISKPSQVIRAKEGRAVVLRSVALAPEFVYLDKAPYNLIPFLGGQAVDLVQNNPPPGVETPDSIAKTLSSLWKGEIAPQAAAQSMAQAWRTALKNRKK